MDIEFVCPELGRLAGRFADQLDQDPAAAAQWWRQSHMRLDGVARETANRLAGSLMGVRQRAALAALPEGASLLLQWEIERRRRPALPRLPFLKQSLGYDYCASLVQQRSSLQAVNAMKQGYPLVLALRRETSMLANRGRGVYDDHFAVLNCWGRRGSVHFFPACTEPGAQYSHRAAPKPGGGRVDPRYADVKFKKADGVDVNADGIKDSGRLREGTYFFREKPAGFLKDRAFRATSAQMAERDTDGDGRFTLADSSRLDAHGVGRSMYIHQGGPTTAPLVNTWSAGCQTVPQNHYRSFLSSLGPNPSFFYVLIDCR
jgi:hypothetical protein